MTDCNYTNGVIAAKEKYLLKDKISRLCELPRDEAFRVLLESGFGGGADADGGVEPLIQKEEELLDAFIREYAPTKAQREYLFAPRDFHNAKAVFKAEALREDDGKMLAPEGNLSIETLRACVRSGDYQPLNEQLKTAFIEAEEAVQEGVTGATGAKIGNIFTKALYGYLSSACKTDRQLKKLLAQKADMVNLLTAFRSQNAEYAKELFVAGGTLNESRLCAIAFGEKDENCYKDFILSCREAKEKGAPFTMAERALSSFETDAFAEKKYELEGKLPFLYYVFRRRAEIENVRMIFVCMAAGMKETELKKRLRSV